MAICKLEHLKSDLQKVWISNGWISDPYSMFKSSWDSKSQCPNNWIIQKPNIFLLWFKMAQSSDETFFWIFRIQNMDCCQDFRCHSKTKHLRANFICVRKATKTIILEPKSTISDILTSKIYCNWTHFYYFNTDYVWYKDSLFKNNPVVPA